MSNPGEKAIERDFCAGVLTLEEVAEKHSITVKALRYMATKKGLKRTKGARQSRGKTGAKKGQKSGAEKTENLPQKMPQKSASVTAKKSPKNVQQDTPIQTDDSVLDPDEFGISEQQALFAQYVAEGNSPSASYRLAGYQSEGNSVHAAASRLLRFVKVSAAIRWLRDKRQKRLALTEDEIIHQLSSIASMDPNAISQIRRVNCRYCWGDSHRYQWRDVDEYERACASALAESKPPPAFEGGIGFVDTTVPNQTCPRCSGEGRMETFYHDTTMLNGPERWGFLGVKETMNGIEVKIASPEAARKELLAYLKATHGKLPGNGQQPSTDKEALELEGLRLRNEKLQAEIENIKNGKQESNLVVVHNALQIPGAVQPTQDTDGGS